MVVESHSVKLFATPEEFEAWLALHFTDTKEIWLQMYKKASGKTSINYDQALDVALCYGWIDGLVNKYDDESYIQRFTPRGVRSKWSKVNTGHIARLTREGKMKPSGLAAVAAAKADGRWEAAYASSKNSTFTPEFLELISANPKAKAFFATLNRANLYAMSYRLENAKKEETKDRLMKQFIEMLERGETFH